MMCTAHPVLLLLYLLLPLARHTLAIPVWPETFSQPFNETNFVGKTTGMYYYDFPNRRGRVDRQNGVWDRFCGSVHPFVATPCQHIIVHGVRYLNFPKLKKCCSCCTAAKGCDILYPDWFARAGAKYIGQTKCKQGGMCDKWQITGFQPNYYWETRDTHVMAELFQVPEADQVFDVHNMKKGCCLPDSLFELPANCTAQCAGPVCNFADPPLDGQGDSKV